MTKEYLMDYIPPQGNGKNPLYAAVMSAREAIRTGCEPGRAIGYAAKRFHVMSSDVAHYVGQVGGRINSFQSAKIKQRPLTHKIKKELVPIVNKPLNECTREDAKKVSEAGILSTSFLSKKQFMVFNDLLSKKDVYKDLQQPIFGRGAVYGDEPEDFD